MKSAFKIAIGIVIGASVTAVAQDFKTTSEIYKLMYPAAGVNPDGNTAAIKVDNNGRVYCSPEQPK